MNLLLLNMIVKVQNREKRHAEIKYFKTRKKEALGGAMYTENM